MLPFKLLTNWGGFSKDRLTCMGNNPISMHCVAIRIQKSSFPKTISVSIYITFQELYIVPNQSFCKIFTPRDIWYRLLDNYMLFPYTVQFQFPSVSSVMTATQLHWQFTAALIYSIFNYPSHWVYAIYIMEFCDGWICRLT